MSPESAFLTTLAVSPTLTASSVVSLGWWAVVTSTLGRDQLSYTFSPASCAGCTSDTHAVLGNTSGN